MVVFIQIECLFLCLAIDYKFVCVVRNKRSCVVGVYESFVGFDVGLTQTFDWFPFGQTATVCDCGAFFLKC